MSRQLPGFRRDGEPNSAAFRADEARYLRGQPLRYCSEQQLLKRFRCLVGRFGSDPFFTHVS